MQLKPPGEDIEATAELPQLDIRILSASLERVDPEQMTATPAAMPEWKLTDRFAELQDQIASLQADLRESENRYSRLSVRHQSLLHKLEEREALLADQQHEQAQSTARMNTLEQQLQQVTAEAIDLKQQIADSLRQRKQRELFILKQASEIKRLRKLQP